MDYAFSKDEHTRALKAFKKRLKLLRLDDESSSIVSAFSSGRQSSIAGIRPPDSFPPEIWAELEQKGRLKRVPGTKDQYMLAQPGK